MLDFGISYINYFFLAVIKHRDQKQLIEEKIIWAMVLEGYESMWLGGLTAGSHCGWNSKLRANQKQCEAFNSPNQSSVTFHF